MMILSEIAEKLEAILNDSDNPVAFQYKVEAQGFHIDHIINKDVGTNFIPVFVASMGGQFNAVPDLKQGTYVIPITFYFPVRFKDEIFKLGDYLVATFVGKYINYGTYSGYAISNLSVPTYGEIQDLDLDQFQEWVENIYQNRVGRKNEPFMSMSINLYLTDAAEGFIFGNSVDAHLVYKGSSHPVVFASSSIQSSAQSNSQQELGAETPEAEGLPFGTAYGMGFTAYVSDIKKPITEVSGFDHWWGILLSDWFAGKAQEMEVRLVLTFNNLFSANKKTVQGVDQEPDPLVFDRTCYIESVNLPIQKGQLLTVTFSLGKKITESNNG